MKSQDPARQVRTMRMALYGLFVLFPILFVQDRILLASENAVVAVGVFFLSIALLLGLLGAITLSGTMAYAAFFAAFASGFLFGLPLFLYASNLAIGLIFAEGISALRPFQSEASQIRRGTSETATSSLAICLKQFRNRFLLVAGSLFLISAGYGLFAQIVPVASGLAALAFYVAIALVAIALTALYLAERE